MKLLLTSSGITNKSIAKALFDLVGKKPKDTSLVFIPTASNIDVGDKSWLIKDLVNLKKLNLKSIDIADISAIDKKIWLHKFKQADILFFGGGDNSYLMDWVNKSGLNKLLPGLLKNKVFVGVSAGSMITSKSCNLSTAQLLYGENLDKKKELQGLNFVDFYFLPHLNSSSFPHVRANFIKNFAQKRVEIIYALDDNSALKIIDKKIDVISEGKWLIFNNF